MPLTVRVPGVSGTPGLTMPVLVTVPTVPAPPRIPVAPIATVDEVLSEPLTISEPTDTTLVPVKVFVPVSVSEPEPVWLRDVCEEPSAIRALMVRLPVTLTLPAMLTGVAPARAAFPVEVTEATEALAAPLRVSIEPARLIAPKVAGPLGRASTVSAARR